MIPQRPPRHLALLCLLLAPAVHAQEHDGEANTLYRCRDDKGVTSYQQQPCGKNQKSAGEVRYSSEAEPAPPPVAPPTPVAPPAVAPPPVAETPLPPPPAPPAPLAPPDRASDAVECLRPDSTTYVRSGQCELSEVGGEPIEGYVTDPKTGERTWMQGETPRRQVRDPARPLGRSEACRLAKEQISRMNARMERSMQLVRDAEGVRDRNCD